MTWNDLDETYIQEEQIMESVFFKHVIFIWTEKSKRYILKT
jgi:hypothetical protein